MEVTQSPNYIMSMGSQLLFISISTQLTRELNDEKIRGNLIILGHLAGDSIGLNAWQTR